MEDDARINRFLASAGFGSRRAVEELVAARRVSLNGVVVETLGVRVRSTDVVKVDGRAVQPEASIHVLLHKPAGVVTTAHDPQGRPTVVELVRIPQRLFPVGRLDANTTGALVLTNDGALANRLMHPRYGVEKTYHATISRLPTPRGLAALANGVMLDDGPTAPAQVSLVRRVPPVVELVLHEGRNRQVRRMIESIGHSVVALHRPTYGGPRARRSRPGNLALPHTGRDRDAAPQHRGRSGADVRLNRYLALAGLGTRRSVERLARSGRIAIGGVAATDPAQPVGPGATVTLDGHPLEARSPCGVLVRAPGGALPPLAHPAELHVAGVNENERLVMALDDARLAATLSGTGLRPGPPDRRRARRWRVPAALSGRARGSRGVRSAPGFASAPLDCEPCATALRLARPR